MKFFVTFTLLALAIQTSSSATMEEYVTTQEYGELLEKVDQLRKLVEYGSLLDKFDQLREKFDQLHKLVESMKGEGTQKYASLVQKVDQLRKVVESVAPSEKCENCVRRNDSRFPMKRYSDCRSVPPKRDCVDHLKVCGKVNGLYIIRLDNNATIEVYCDQTTDGGGWTVFQRRRDGSVNFQRSWSEYKNGFGDPSNEFWLGNEYIHLMTSHSTELRIDIDEAGLYGYKYWKYNPFYLENETSKYRLKAEGHGSGLYPNILRGCQRRYFSTYDRDNDGYKSYNYAQIRNSAWWFGPKCTTSYSGLNRMFHFKDGTVRKVEMKMRREERIIF